MLLLRGLKSLYNWTIFKLLLAIYIQYIPTMKHENVIVYIIFMGFFSLFWNTLNKILFFPHCSHFFLFNYFSHKLVHSFDVKLSSKFLSNVRLWMLFYMDTFEISKKVQGILNIECRSKVTALKNTVYSCFFLENEVMTSWLMKGNSYTNSL